jgi:hypothetical protein
MQANTKYNFCVLIANYSKIINMQDQYSLSLKYKYVISN